MRVRNILHTKPAVLKRLGVVVGVIVVIIAAIQIILYVTRPQISYSLKEADCSSAAIAARNKATGGERKSCILIISAKNLQNRSVYVDYDGVGGGPAGPFDPLIRIYSKNGTFCYALIAGEGSSFAPNATNELTLRCGGVQNPPKNYGEESDTNPSSIVIADYSDITIHVNPK